MKEIHPEIVKYFPPAILGHIISMLSRKEREEYKQYIKEKNSEKGASVDYANQRP